MSVLQCVPVMPAGLLTLPTCAVVKVLVQAVDSPQEVLLVHSMRVPQQIHLCHMGCQISQLISCCNELCSRLTARMGLLLSHVLVEEGI